MEIKRSSNDLKGRVLKFVLEVVSLVKNLPENRTNHIFFSQIIRSSSSIGANYEEADGTVSKKDFLYKMSLVKKEAKETKYWLKLLRLTNEIKYSEKIDNIGIENEELIRIFSSIIIKSNSV